MTAPTVEHASATSTDDGPDVVHLYCCDPGRAWCGADISTLDDNPDDSNPECPLCVYANHTFRACACQNT